MKLYSQHLSPHLGNAEPEPSPMIEMNTTPLIDVMLVLIVMLIITIPVQLHSVNLDMPSAQVSVVVPEVVVLQMDASGYLRWGEDMLADAAALNAKVANAAAMAVQPELHLRPAPETPYAYVAAFLATAQKAGLTKVGVVN